MNDFFYIFTIYVQTLRIKEALVFEYICCREGSTRVRTQRGEGS